MKDKLKMVKVSEIILDERFRVDLGNIQELMESIQDKGILQPITLSTDLHLLAGGRRYTAAKELGLVEIPALLRQIEGEIDAREIELIENIHRKEFTWQEQAKLIARIDALYREKDVNWSGRKTAQLIDQNPMNVSRALRLASAMEVLPSLGESKTADEALKVIKKAEEDMIVQELVKRQKDTIAKSDGGGTMSSKERGLATMLKIANENYIIGDTFKHMGHMRANGHVDLIECDPPYGVELAKTAGREDVSQVIKERDEAYQEIGEKEYPDFLQKLAKETYRVAGKDCWMIFWFAFRWHHEVITSLQEAGWQLDVVPALWAKGNGRTPRPDILLARTYEPFFLCRKGQPTLINQGRMNVFQGYSAGEYDKAEKKFHPAQRPCLLMEDLLATCLDGMKSVLVPFAGSGATLRACYKLGHSVVGFDSNGDYKNQFLLAVEEDTKKILNTQ